MNLPQFPGGFPGFPAPAASAAPAPVAPAAPLGPVSFFDQSANNMDPSSRYPFFPVNFAGEVQVDQTKGITTRKGVRAFIVEFTVVSSNLTDVPVGDKRTWFQDLTEAGTAYPACISFLYAALGLDMNRHKAAIAAQIKPQQDKWLNRAANEPNLLAGARVRLQTSNKVTKKNKDFTIHNFTATQEMLAQSDQRFAAVK